MTRPTVPAALTGLVTLLLCAPASAAPQGERTPLDLAEESSRSSTAGGGGLVRTFVGLAIVLAVIYGLHWILKQVKASRDERATGDGLATLATLPLGAGRSLHVVRAGHEIVVLGVAEHGVVPIRSYTEDEARAAGLIVERAEQAPARPPLTRALDAAAGALRARRAAGAGEEPAPARARALRTGGVVSLLRAWTVRG